MRTDDLIIALSQSPQPKRAMDMGLLALCLAIACMAITYLLIGFRADLAAFPLSFWQKTVFLGAMALSLSSSLSRVSRPIARPHSAVLPLLTAVFYGTWLLHDVLAISRAEFLNLLQLPNFILCLKVTTSYGLLVLGGLAYAMRRFAPVDIEKASWYTGLAAISMAGFGYSLHCPIDNPIFILFAYGLPALFVTLVARLALPRLLRW